jgi:broad specificity phosphatase PhoE
LAKALGVHLRSSGMDFDAVYSSPIERAKQTAYIVCQVMDGIDIEHATIAPHVIFAFI